MIGNYLGISNFNMVNPQTQLVHLYLTARTLNFNLVISQTQQSHMSNLTPGTPEHAHTYWWQ